MFLNKEITMKGDQMKSKTMFVCTLFCLLTSAFAKAEDVAVTVYNNNLGLVKDNRKLELKQGVQEFRFKDVAAQIDPTSVHFKTPKQPQDVSILEQNYEFDLVGTNRLLQKYVDQFIEVFTKEGKLFQGKLLSSQSGDIILQNGDGKITILKSSAVERINFPKLPQGLFTQPTLVWLLSCNKAGKYDSEISYLTKGISWHAEYVAVANKDDSELEISGWVSIDNKSGATYKDAKLKLVAGDVNRVPERRGPPQVAMDVMRMASVEKSGFEEKSFFEYHLYTLQRAATVRDRQIKQISLFEPAKTKTKKIFTYDGQNNDNKVKVNLEFVNDKKSGLGMPLPKGKIRVYKQDDDGSQEFIGEDEIDHTPKNEKLRIYLGNAFDIVGERTILKDDKVGKRTRKQTISVELRNRKEEAVSVRVVENFWGDAKLVGPTPPIIEQDARKVEFRVDIPADSVKTIEYTVLHNY
jgi:hypothetical protein